MREGRQQLSTLAVVNGSSKEDNNNVRSSNNNTNNNDNDNDPYNHNGSIRNPPAPSKEFDLNSPQPSQENSQQMASPTKGGGSDRTTPRIVNYRRSSLSSSQHKADSYLATTSTLVGTSKHHPLEKAGVGSSKPDEKTCGKTALDGAAATTNSATNTSFDLMEQAVLTMPPPPLEYQISQGKEHELERVFEDQANEDAEDDEEPQEEGSHESHNEDNELEQPPTSEYYLDLGRHGRRKVDPPASSVMLHQSPVVQKMEIPLNSNGKSAEYYLGLASPNVSPHVVLGSSNPPLKRSEYPQHRHSIPHHHYPANINITSRTYHNPSPTNTDKNNYSANSYKNNSDNSNTLVKNPPTSLMVDPMVTITTHPHQMPRRNPFDPQPEHDTDPDGQPQDGIIPSSSLSSNIIQSKLKNSREDSATISPSSHTTGFASFFGDTYASSGIAPPIPATLPQQQHPPHQPLPLHQPIVINNNSSQKPPSAMKVNSTNTTTTTLTASTAKLSDLGRRLAQLSIASLGNSVGTAKRLPTVMETTGHSPSQVFADEESSVGSRSAYPQRGGGGGGGEGEGGASASRGDASTFGGSSSYPTVGGGDSSFGGSSGGFLMDGGSSVGGSSAYNSQDLGMYDSLHKVYRDMLARSMERQKMLEKQLQDDDSTYDGRTFAGGGSSAGGGNSTVGGGSSFAGGDSFAGGGSSTNVGGSSAGTISISGDGNSTVFGGGDDQSHQGEDQKERVIVYDVAMEMLQQLTASQHGDTGLLLAKAAAASINATNEANTNNNNCSNERRPSSPTATHGNSVSTDPAPSSSYISSSGSSDTINAPFSTRTVVTDSTNRSLEVSSADDESQALNQARAPLTKDVLNQAEDPIVDMRETIEPTDHSRSMATDESVFSEYTNQQFSESTMSVKWGNEDAPPSVTSSKAMKEAFTVLSPSRSGPMAVIRSVFSPLGARAPVTKLISDSDMSEINSGHPRVDSGGCADMNARKVFSSHGATAPGSKLVSDSDFSDLESGPNRGDSCGAVSSGILVSSTAEGAVIGNDASLVTNSTQQTASELSLTINKANALLTQAAIQSRIKREEQRKQATVILSSSLKEKPRFSLPRPRPKSSPTTTGKQGILKTWTNPPGLPEDYPAKSMDESPEIISEGEEGQLESYPEPTLGDPKSFAWTLPLHLWKACTTDNFITHWRWVLCIFTFVLVAIVVGSVVGANSSGSSSDPINALQPVKGATVSPASSLPFALAGVPIATSPPSPSPPTKNLWIPDAAMAPSTAPASPTPKPGISSSQPTQIFSTSLPTTAPFVLPPHIQQPNHTSPSLATLFHTQSPTASPIALSNATSRNVMSLLQVKSLDGGRALQNTTSPQYQAYKWLVNNSNLDSYADEVLVQRYALATFFYSTLGQQWTSHTGWLSDQPECDWFTTASIFHFTVCNGKGIIINLDLKNNNVGGSLPAELALLSDGLNRMNLSFNNLVGSFPTELGLLSNIDTISVRSNKLTGSIPSQIGSWTQAVAVDFGFNRFSGDLPSRIGELSLLSVLDVQENRLSGNVPLEIGNLKNCTRLRLSQNRFVGTVPTQLGSLSNLNELDLGSNAFTNIPTQIGSLTKLQIFSLQNNSAGGTIPSEIGLMTQLQSILLGSNSLIGTIPTTLGLITSVLETIDLSRNQLVGPIPPELGKLTLLRQLSLQSNQLSGPVPPSFASLTLLDTLRLDNNNLIGQMPALVCLNVGKSLGEIWADCAKVNCSCCSSCLGHG